MAPSGPVVLVDVQRLPEDARAAPPVSAVACAVAGVPDLRGQGARVIRGRIDAQQAGLFGITPARAADELPGQLFLQLDAVTCCDCGGSGDSASGEALRHCARCQGFGEIEPAAPVGHHPTECDACWPLDPTKRFASRAGACGWLRRS